MFSGEDFVKAICFELGLILFGLMTTGFLVGWGACALIRWLF